MQEGVRDLCWVCVLSQELSFFISGFGDSWKVDVDDSPVIKHIYICLAHRAVAITAILNFRRLVLANKVIMGWCFYNYG